MKQSNNFFRKSRVVNISNSLVSFCKLNSIDNIFHLINVSDRVRFSIIKLEIMANLVNLNLISKIGI